MQSQFKFAAQVGLLALLLACPQSVEAKANGAAYIGCDGCHNASDDPPAFELSSEPETFSPGDTVSLELRISGASTRGAGYYFTTKEGQFELIDGENAKIISENLAHRTPLAANAGTASVKFRWTAPNEPGGTDFQVYGLSTNGDGRRAGDTPGQAMLSVVYGCTGSVFYQDLDGDGIGSSAYGTTKDCVARDGWVPLDGDCNENNAEVFPGQTEVCNEKDDDCDGEVDEGTSPRELFPDEDGDGFGVNRDVIVGCVPPQGYTDNPDDCDDRDPAVNPDAVEVCNGRDDNCNGRRDERVRDRCGVGLCERYAVSCFSDACYPGEPLPEECNGLDDDCDGVVDNDTTCPEGQTCYMLQCTDDEDVGQLPEGPAPAGAGAPGTPPNPDSPPPPQTEGEAPAPGAGSEVPASSTAGCGVMNGPRRLPAPPVLLLVLGAALALRSSRESA